MGINVPTGIMTPIRGMCKGKSNISNPTEIKPILKVSFL